MGTHLLTTTLSNKMFLYEYIGILESVNSDKKMKHGLGKPHSWRGRYDELAFEPVKDTTIGDMLSEAYSANGTMYTGWKGGDYQMDLDTLVNIDYEGTCDIGDSGWDDMVANIQAEDTGGSLMDRCMGCGVSVSKEDYLGTCPSCGFVYKNEASIL